MDGLHELRVFAIIAWIQLPTIMYGGYALMGLLARDGHLSEFQRSMFRAGHAHAGVLTLLSLLYNIFLAQVDVAFGLKIVASVALLAGILLQSGGFFLHMARGGAGQRSVGTTATTAGAVLLVVCSLFLAWALAFRW